MMLNSYILLLLFLSLNTWAMTPVLPGASQKRTSPKTVTSPPLTSSLQATVLSAKTADPELYRYYQQQMTQIQKSCQEAPKKLQEIQHGAAGMMTKKKFTLNQSIYQNMHLKMAKALNNLIARMTTLPTWMGYA